MLVLFSAQSNDPKLIAHTKAIHGLCVDPNESNRIASFAKVIVCYSTCFSYHRQCHKSEIN